MRSQLLEEKPENIYTYVVIQNYVLEKAEISHENITFRQKPLFLTTFDEPGLVLVVAVRDPVGAFDPRKGLFAYVQHCDGPRPCELEDPEGECVQREDLFSRISSQ